MVETGTLRQPPNREPLWLLLDVLLAAVLGWLTVSSMRGQSYDEQFGRVEAAGWVVVLAPTALLTVRRLAPVTVLVTSAACYLLSGIDHGDGNWILAAPFAAYMVTVVHGAVPSARVIVPTALAVSLVGFYGPGGTSLISVAVILAIYAVGWAIGVRVGHNHRHTNALAEDARTAREHADAVARQAVADERARIAIELHDAVGHAVNVMVMQAGAARLATSDTRTKSTLLEIERVGRSALTDLDRMLGLLHDHPEAGTLNAPVGPAHGINDIAAIVAGVRAGGAEVVLHNRCAGKLDPVADRPVSAAVDVLEEIVMKAVLTQVGSTEFRIAGIISFGDADNPAGATVVSFTLARIATVGHLRRPTANGSTSSSPRSASPSGSTTALRSCRVDRCSESPSPAR